MKKFLISIIIAILAIGGLSAQNVTFGVTNGLNLSSMMPAGETTPLNDGFSMRPAPNFGIFTELQVNPTVSFRLGVGYSGFGGRRHGMQAMPTQRLVNEIVGSLGMIGMIGEMINPGVMEQVMDAMNTWSDANPYYFVNVENTVRFGYVMIPLTAQFGWNIGQSPWRIYAGAGPFVSFILSAEEVARGTSHRYLDADGTTTLWDIVPDEIRTFIEDTPLLSGIATDLRDPVSFGTSEITGEMRSANFGVSANLGIRYQHNRHSFFFEVGGNYGFIPVQANGNAGRNRLGALSFSLGYSVALW